MLLTAILCASLPLALAYRLWRGSRRKLAEAAALARTLDERVRETVRALDRDRAQLASILDNIVEAVAAVDEQGRLIAANPAMRALMGGADASPGRPFVETLRQPKLQELLSSLLKEGQARVEEVSLFNPEELYFEAHAVPLREGGRTSGGLLVLHDITRLRRLEQVRREFVANVSHELRTPLASIRGFAETLRDGAIDDKENRMEFIEAIEKDAQRLSALVDDLLDLSAIESGQRPLARQPVDLVALLRETAAGLRSRGKIEVAAGELPRVSGDRAKLKQVFTNLLDNAVKFNKEGGKVAVSFTVQGPSLCVSIADTGAGIPAEDLPRIFERFYRVDKARTRDVGGTGLGLSIVKHLVEAHGGTVSVESREGAGSTFRVTLPLA